MKHKGVAWGLALLPVWGLAGGLILLVALAPFFQFKKGLKTLTRHPLPLTLLLLLLVLPLISSPNPSAHVLGFLSRYLLPVLLLHAWGQYLRQGGSPEVLGKALLAGGLGLSAVGLVSLLLPRPFHWQSFCLPDQLATQACILDFSLLPVFQAQGIAMNPNILGGLLVLLLPWVWVSFERDRLFSLYWTVLMLSVFGAAILLSGSRNAWLAMACLSAGVLFRQGTATWREGRGVMRGAAVLLLMGVAGAFVVTQRYSDTGRWMIWKVGLELLQQSPWTGVGLLSVEPMYQRLHTGWPQAAHLHNGFLQMMVESGVFLTFALFSYLVYRVYSQWRWISVCAQERVYSKTALTSMCLLVGMSIVDFILLDVRVMVYMTVIVACAFYPSKTQPH